MIHLMAMSHSFVLCPSDWRQMRIMASLVMNRRELAVIYDEVLTVYMSDMQP